MITTAIIGAGFIGKKRALSLNSSFHLTAICDIDPVKGGALANELACQFVTDWKTVINNPAIDAVIIATTHNQLAEIAIGALGNKKHVFIEKPGGRNAAEVSRILEAHQQHPAVVMFGYNHRYHPAMQQAKKVIDSKQFGPVLFIRARYGHGGRLGYEKEWRFNKEISGGGELIDQGPHLIDLVQYLVGPMPEVKGYTATVFWPTPQEDTAFFMLKNDHNQFAQLSVSCVEWKNIFSFEIMLNKAKIQIDGLGRSYGTERLVLYKMKPEMGPPEVEEFEFPSEDKSWNMEMDIFAQRIQQGETGPRAIQEALYVLETIQKLYDQNKS